MKGLDHVQSVARGAARQPVQSLLLMLLYACSTALLCTIGSVLLQTRQVLAQLAAAPGARALTLVTTESDFQGVFDGRQYLPIKVLGEVGAPLAVLHETDLQAIKEAVSTVAYAYTTLPLFLPANSVAGGGSLFIQSATPDYLNARQVTLLHGRLPTAQEHAERRHVIVVTEAFAQRAWPDQNPTAQELTSPDGVAYRVVGVIRPSPGDPDLTSSAEHVGAVGVVPYRALPYTLPSGEGLGSLTLLPLPGQDTVTRAALRTYAESRWPGGVRLRANADLQQQTQQRQQSLLLALMLLSGGALAASGAAMARMMIVRVITRQREIGIAGALGASRTHTFSDLLMEAALLCTLGGMGGVFLAAFLGTVLNRLYVQLSEGTDVAVVRSGAFTAFNLNGTAALVGVTICLAIGLIFSLYPAWQAASLRPSEALRA